MFNGDGALTRGALNKYSPLNSWLKGSGANFFQQRLFRWIILRDVQAAETPVVVKSQNQAAVQNEIPVNMRFLRRAAAYQAQAAGHPEMQDHGAGLQTDQQVLRAPIDTAHDLMTHSGFESVRDRPTQATIANDHIDDAMIHESRRNAASRRFYFRKLRQQLRSWAGYLIFDSL